MATFLDLEKYDSKTVFLDFQGIDVHAYSSEGWTALSFASRDRARVGTWRYVQKLAEDLGCDDMVRNATGEKCRDAGFVE
jgi:hypothetical protein|eukprot:evm.model.NODE_11016_length_15147_cov_34.876411.2